MTTRSGQAQYGCGFLQIRPKFDLSARNRPRCAGVELASATQPLPRSVLTHIYQLQAAARQAATATCRPGIRFTALISITVFDSHAYLRRRCACARQICTARPARGYLGPSLGSLPPLACRLSFPIVPSPGFLPAPVNVNYHPLIWSLYKLNDLSICIRSSHNLPAFRTRCRRRSHPAMTIPIASPQPRSALNPRLLSSRRPAAPSSHSPDSQVSSIIASCAFVHLSYHAFISASSLKDGSLAPHDSRPPSISSIPVPTGLRYVSTLLDASSRLTRSQATRSATLCSPINKRRRNVAFNAVRSPRRRHCLRTECPMSPLSGPAFFDSIPWISQLEQMPDDALPMDIADLSVPENDCMRPETPCSGPMRTRKTSLRSNPLAHTLNRVPDFSPPDLHELPIYALLPHDPAPSTPRTPIREPFIPSEVQFCGLRPVLNGLGDDYSHASPRMSGRFD